MPSMFKELSSREKRVQLAGKEGERDKPWAERRHRRGEVKEGRR